MQNRHGDRIFVVLDVLGGWDEVDGDFSLGHIESETLIGHLDGNV